MAKNQDINTVIQLFSSHVSKGKADFFKKYGMDFVMGEREGSVLSDISGKKQLFNLHCNGGVFNLGHRNPELMEVLVEAMEELDIGNHHLMSKERAELAAMIAGLMPGDLNYSIFGVSGGEAVDLSIKIARGYTGRKQIISAIGAYHGHTGLALATGDAQYRKPFGHHPSGFKQVLFGDLLQLDNAINENTAAVILETIPATVGMRIPSVEYIQGVRDKCDQTGALLILDEVQTGLGRTGKLWAFEHYDIVPDIVVLGKGLSGGLYPISATIIREPLERIFHPDPFIHISTFGGAEIGCRVAKKVLEVSSAPDFLVKVNELAKCFKLELGFLHEKHPGFFTELRQLGLMIGIKLRDERSGPILTKTAYDQDLLLVYANNDQSVCQFLPPLNMKTKDINDVVRRLGKAITSAKRLRLIAKGVNFFKS